MALKFQKVKVAKVIRETSDAVSICFENPDKQLFTYIPGQYLTLKIEIDGKNFNRAYSLSSSPFTDEYLAVTVKVTPGGKVSTWLNAAARDGQYIDIMPPLGNFTAKIDPSHQVHYVLIGAGSGITPLMSILQSVLVKEPGSKVSLVFGNRNTESVIFKEKFIQLEGQYPGRFKVIHCLSQPSSDWQGRRGRLQCGSITEILQQEINDSLKKEYFICGPSGMMEEAATALKNMGVPNEQVHQEHFSAPLTHADAEDKPVSANESKEVIQRNIKVILEGKEMQISVSPSNSILDAALDHDLDPPYACMIGSCCTCKAKLVSGKVIMDDREGLTDEEIADGFVLTCQSHPLSDNVVVNYDEI